MFASRALSVAARSLHAQCKTSMSVYFSQNIDCFLLSSKVLIHSLFLDTNKGSQELQNTTALINSTAWQGFAFSTSASTKSNKKSNLCLVKEKHECPSKNAESGKTSTDDEAKISPPKKSLAHKKESRKLKRAREREGKVFSKDLKGKGKVTVDELWKLVVEMEEELKLKDKEIEKLKLEKVVVSSTDDMDAKLQPGSSNWKSAMAAMYIYIAAQCLNITILVILVMGVLF